MGRGSNEFMTQEAAARFAAKASKQFLGSKQKFNAIKIEICVPRTFTSNICLTSLIPISILTWQACKAGRPQNEQTNYCLLPL